MFRASLAFDRVVLSGRVTSLLLLMLVGIFDDTAEFYFKEKVEFKTKTDDNRLGRGAKTWVAG